MLDRGMTLTVTNGWRISVDLLGAMASMTLRRAPSDAAQAGV